MWKKLWLGPTSECCKNVVTKFGTLHAKEWTKRLFGHPPRLDLWKSRNINYCDAQSKLWRALDSPMQLSNAGEGLASVKSKNTARFTFWLHITVSYLVEPRGHRGQRGIKLQDALDEEMFLLVKKSETKSFLTDDKNAKSVRSIIFATSKNVLMTLVSKVLPMADEAYTEKS